MPGLTSKERLSAMALDGLEQELIAKAIGGDQISIQGLLVDPSPSTVRTQVPVPVQPPPLQPRNTEPAWGMAEMVIELPWSTVIVQTPGQLSPPGLVTAPARCRPAPR
jgi:hypothetical protein